MMAEKNEPRTHEMQQTLLGMLLITPQELRDKSLLSALLNLRRRIPHYHIKQIKHPLYSIGQYYFENPRQLTNIRQQV
jgi:hypothetical protein